MCMWNAECFCLIRSEPKWGAKKIRKCNRHYEYAFTMHNENGDWKPEMKDGNCGRQGHGADKKGANCENGVDTTMRCEDNYNSTNTKASISNKIALYSFGVAGARFSCFSVCPSIRASFVLVSIAPFISHKMVHIPCDSCHFICAIIYSVSCWCQMHIFPSVRSRLRPSPLCVQPALPLFTLMHMQLCTQALSHPVYHKSACIRFWRVCCVSSVLSASHALAFDTMPFAWHAEKKPKKKRTHKTYNPISALLSRKVCCIWWKLWNALSHCFWRRQWLYLVVQLV